MILPYSSAAPSKKSKATFKVVHMESNQENQSNIQPIPSTTSSDNKNLISSISKERKENIESVKSILDYLGEGFINACLELYNDNVEVVCDRILSENLAEPLLELDRSMPLETSTSVSSIPPPSQDFYQPVSSSNFIPLPDEFSSFHIGKM